MRADLPVTRCRRHFIIIGAMKAGTTSLFRFLTSHPEISGSAAKELHYFSLDAARFGRVGYSLKFLGLPGPVVGEASPSYSEYPRFGDTARRIRMLLPRVKLIYCVRDPVDRMRSHFNHEILEGRQAPSLSESAWTTEYLGPSLYGLQLERYLRYFEPSSIAVVHANQLRDERAATLAALYDFLEVDPGWIGATELSDENISEERVRISPTVAPLKRSPAARRIARLLPASLRGRLRTAVSVRKPTVDGEATPVPVDIAPIPTDMLALIHADREVFLDTASQCVVIGDRPPETWWADDFAATDGAQVMADALRRRREPTTREHIV
jgi:hypothetical protein